MQLLLVGFVFYFSIIGIIALASYINNKNLKTNDYSQAILGNRSINYFLTALSAHASDMSDWLFMAFPAALYAGGLVKSWIAIGLVLGMLFTWQFIAPQLRSATEKLDSLTLSTFFERRFNDKSGVLRILSAAMSLLFFAVYIAAGLKGFGFLAESVFNLSYVTGTLIALFCVIAYMILGGYKALAWIDCFQALFLFTVILIVPYISFFHIGGWQSIVESAASKNIPLTLFTNNLTENINLILMSISWSVGYFGMPHILTKFMGIRSVKEINKAKYVGMFWQITVLIAAGLVGLIGIAFFKETLQNKELVFVEIVKSLFNPLSSGFILSAVAGATLSVITAQVLVIVSVLTEDFYKGIIRPKASSQELLWVYRIGIIVVAIMSFCVSLDKAKSIQQLVYYAWMGFGCAFGPIVLLSLHSKYINKYGAGASIFVGGLIAALWNVFGRSIVLSSTSIDVPAVIPGFLLSIIAAYLMTYLTKNKTNF